MQTLLRDIVPIDKYEVMIADLGSQTLGEADMENKKILLSKRVFEEGKKQLAMCLVEEYAHLESGSGDYTRAFQDFLFRKIVGLVEINQKVIL